MPTDAPGQDAPAPPVPPTGPIISASRGQVLIMGAGFLPDCAVTVRITYIGEDIVDCAKAGVRQKAASAAPAAAAVNCLIKCILQKNGSARLNGPRLRMD